MSADNFWKDTRPIQEGDFENKNNPNVISGLMVKDSSGSLCIQDDERTLLIFEPPTAGKPEANGPSYSRLLEFVGREVFITIIDEDSKRAGKTRQIILGWEDEDGNLKTEALIG